METDFSQYVAAALLEFSTQDQRGISTHLSEMFDVPRVQYDWDVERTQITAAIEILRDLNLAGISRDPYAGEFIAIPERSFRDFWISVTSDETRYNERMIEDDLFLGNKEEMRRFPYLHSVQPYPIIRKYGQFGSSWLAAALANLRVNNTTRRDSRIIDSSSWTGRYNVSDADRAVVAAQLRTIIEEIEASGLSNSQKSEARAIILACQALVESPEPAWEIVIKLLGSPVLANITAIAALAIVLIKGS